MLEINRRRKTCFRDSGFGQVTVLFSSVQLLCPVWLFVTPWSARQASLSITNSRSPPKPMSIELVMPSNNLILCSPLILLPSIFPSIRVFSNELALHIRWPKYWSFSFNSRPSSEHPGLISFRMDWLDLLAVQGTLQSLLQHHIHIKNIIITIKATFPINEWYQAGLSVAILWRFFLYIAKIFFWNLLLYPKLVCSINSLQGFLILLYIP